MSKMIGNAVMLVAGFFLMLGGAISIAIIFAYATSVVLLREAQAITPPGPDGQLLKSLPNPNR
jgi:hypothetical protein